MRDKCLFVGFILLLCSVVSAAQATSGVSPNRLVEQKSLSEQATTIVQEKLPAGSKVFVAPMPNGFDTYLVAGLTKKQVPLVVVIDRNKADYEISGVSESEKAGWAKMLFLGSQQSAEQASIKVMNLQTGNVVFAYSVNKGNSVRGKQSAGEACAKHIKEKIEGRN